MIKENIFGSCFQELSNVELRKHDVHWNDYHAYDETEFKSSAFAYASFH